MSDTLIEKTMPALTSFFALGAPDQISTPFYLKRDNNSIPFWGFGMSSDYPNGGFFFVNSRSADGKQTIKVRVLLTDEIYFTTEAFTLTGVTKAIKDAIYTYDGMTLQTLSSFADSNSDLNKNSTKAPSPSIRFNKTTTYKNIEEDKKLIKFHLQKRIDDANALSDIPVGVKNLLYFSAFADPLYITMLEICLKTIHKFTPSKNFDILFITDDPTQTLISGLPIVSEFNVNYLVLNNVSDPVEASAQKIRIFEFVKINYYQKILFFDVDMITLGDINQIFEKSIVTNTLDAVKVNNGSPVSANHSLSFFDETELQYILDNELRPFNAGHFMFINSNKMIEHFKNVYWLYNVWPGAYFYEQSFMNYYFNICLKNVSYQVLNSHILIGSYIPANQKKTDGTKLAVHFIGGSNKSKLNGINSYISLNSIEI